MIIINNTNESKLIDANIKLQDKNKELKFMLNVKNETIERIKTYIMVNKDTNDKVSIQGILEILGDNYE